MDAFTLVSRVQMPSIQTLPQFLAYLRFLEAVMRASEDLMEEAVSHSTGELNLYFKAHLEEERGHAKWMARDIVSLGGEPSLIDHGAAALAGAQYYYIRHVGAWSFLGYLVAMEGNSAPVSAIAAMEKAFGEHGCRTLRYHAEHDPKHAKDLRVMIEMHDDDNVIAYNAAMTAHMYRHFVTERMEEANG